jgi:hypothetical protein
MRGAVDVFQYRRQRARARGRGTRRNRATTAVQSFAAVRARAETTIQTGVEAMTLAVLSAFDPHVRDK